MFSVIPLFHQEGQSENESLNLKIQSYSTVLVFGLETQLPAQTLELPTSLATKGWYCENHTFLVEIKVVFLHFFFSPSMKIGAQTYLQSALNCAALTLEEFHSQGKEEDATPWQ